MRRKLLDNRPTHRGRMLLRELFGARPVPLAAQPLTSEPVQAGGVATGEAAPTRFAHPVPRPHFSQLAVAQRPTTPA